MASYVPITDAEDDPESPATSYWAKRLKNNLIGVAQRAAGAPWVQQPTIERLTGSGNWTVPDEVTRIRVRAVGGGGNGYPGGGGLGAGGGGGGYVEGFLDVTPGALIAYVVGGVATASTFNGAGSFSAGGGANAASANSGVGGTGSGSDVVLAIQGQEGELDDVAKTTDAGGASHLSPASNRGAVGLAYGGGGGFDGATGYAGAAGTIILEY